VSQLPEAHKIETQDNEGTIMLNKAESL
jgi:hypothetical protein